MLTGTTGRTEITRAMFERMRTRQVNPDSKMPGGVYEVLPPHYKR